MSANHKKALAVSGCSGSDRSPTAGPRVWEKGGLRRTRVRAKGAPAKRNNNRSRVLFLQAPSQAPKRRERRKPRGRGQGQSQLHGRRRVALEVGIHGAASPFRPPVPFGSVVFRLRRERKTKNVPDDASDEGRKARHPP